MGRYLILIQLLPACPHAALTIITIIQSAPPVSDLIRFLQAGRGVWAAMKANSRKTL
ncbi:MAG: hypothetical protein LQ340_003585, partial [Diploschistes diacapsis]